MAYIPRRGDIVWISLDPQAGHEQAGRRPALVISPTRYNERIGLIVICPITNKVKGYPFEVALTSPQRVTGVVLADQIKSQDWKARTVEYIETASDETIDEVLGKINALLFE